MNPCNKIEEHPAIAGQLGIRSIPAVIAFFDGQPVDMMTGAVPESEVQAFVTRLSGYASQAAVALEELLASVKEMMQQGEFAAASGLYAQILQEELANSDSHCRACRLPF